MLVLIMHTNTPITFYGSKLLRRLLMLNELNDEWNYLNGELWVCPFSIIPYFILSLDPGFPFYYLSTSTLLPLVFSFYLIVSGFVLSVLCDYV